MVLVHEKHRTLVGLSTISVTMKKGQACIRVRSLLQIVPSRDLSQRELTGLQKEFSGLQKRKGSLGISKDQNKNKGITKRLKGLPREAKGRCKGN